MNGLVLINKYIELSKKYEEFSNNKDIPDEIKEKLKNEVDKTLAETEELIPTMSTIEKFRLIDALKEKRAVIIQKAHNRFVENSDRELYYYEHFVNKIREDLSRQSTVEKTK